MGVEQRVSEDYYKTLIKDIIENNEKEKAIKIIANKLNKKQISNEKEILANIEKIIEIERLNNIIKEVREWAKKYSCQFTNDDGELVVSEISFNIQAKPCDLFKILDKENKND